VASIIERIGSGSASNLMRVLIRLTASCIVLKINISCVSKVIAVACKDNYFNVDLLN